MGLMKI